MRELLLRLIAKNSTGLDKAIAAHKADNLARVDGRKLEPVPYDPKSKLTGFARALAAHQASKKNLISVAGHPIA
jgi:hypothetical protein